MYAIATHGDVSKMMIMMMMSQRQHIKVHFGSRIMTSRRHHHKTKQASKWNSDNALISIVPVQAINVRRDRRLVVMIVLQRHNVHKLPVMVAAIGR